MLIGQTVLAPTTPGAVYYTPWMPRQGNALRAVVEFFRRLGTLTLTCEVETKNNEDSDATITSLGSYTVTTTAAGASSSSVMTGCRELVRYKFTATGSSAIQWVHFRSNPPIWLPN